MELLKINYNNLKREGLNLSKNEIRRRLLVDKTLHLLKLPIVPNLAAQCDIYPWPS